MSVFKQLIFSLPLLISLGAENVFAIQKFLPPAKVGDPISKERQLMLSLEQRAIKEGKGIVLDISAAWCGPCAQVRKYIKDNPAVLEKVKEKYIVVTSDQEMYTVTSELVDFLPFHNFWYPTILIYEVGRGWDLAVGGATVETYFTSILAHSSEAKRPASEIIQEFEKLVAAGVKFEASSPPEILNLLNLILERSFFQYDFSENKNLQLAFFRAMKQRPNQFPDYDSNYFFYSQVSGFSLYLQEGQTSLNQIEQDFPDFAVRMKQGISGFRNYFDFPLYRLIQTQGIDVADAACRGLIAEAKRATQDEFNNPDSWRKFLQHMDFRSQLTCIHLSILNPSKSKTQILGELDQLDEQVKNSSVISEEAKESLHLESWGARFALQDYGSAHDIYQKRLTNEVAHLEKSKLEEEAALAQARKDDDKALIALYEQQLKDLAFQTEYVKAVGQSILDAIDRHQPISAMEVL